MEHRAEDIKGKNCSPREQSRGPMRTPWEGNTQRPKSTGWVQAHGGARPGWLRAVSRTAPLEGRVG